MPEIKCPQCNAAIPYADADEGKAVKCPSCNAAVLAIRAADKLLGLKCTECGGVMNTSPGSSQLVCPFCNATFLLPPTYAAPAPAAAGPAAQVPQYIAPLAVTKDKILPHLVAWLNKGAFTAGDADTAAVVTALTAKYVPLYVFTCDATSSWVGQYSTTQYRSVTRTRQTASGRSETYTDQEPYKEWHQTSGVHAGHYRVAVAGAASVPDADLDKLAGDAASFKNDEGAVPYGTGARGDDLPLETPAFDAAEGWRRAQVKVDALERAACGKEVERLTSCTTQIPSHDGRLSYQPLWWINYSYKGKPFNCLMDGRTGAATGKKPKSKTKIILAIVAAVILVLLIILLIVCIGGGYLASNATSLLRLTAEGARALA